MQDLGTGQLRELPIAKAFRESLPIDRSNPFVQAAMDEVQPDRSKQGPVLAVGEVLEIKGGRFRIAKMTHTRLYLDSLPAD